MIVWICQVKKKKNVYVYIFIGEKKKKNGYCGYIKRFK